MNKLFVFDIDGTLVNRQYELKSEIIEAINILLDMGYYVATCSGRSFKGSMRFLSQFKDGNKFAICANGSMIYKYNGEMIDYRPLKYKDYLKVYKHTKKVDNFFTYFYSKDELYHIYYDMCIELDKFSNKMESFNVEDKFKPNDLVDKIMVRDKSREFMEHYKIPCSLKLNYQAVKSSKVFLEVTNKQATKGKGVERLRKHLKISKENVYVFGDSGNDLSMIKKFKNSVAMGNATDEIKNNASYITKSVEDCGISYALREIFKII